MQVIYLKQIVDAFEGSASVDHMILAIYIQCEQIKVVSSSFNDP